MTWNKQADVLRLLESLERLEYENHEIAMVDNASSDNTVVEVRARYPRVTVIENCENLGGTGGFNTGLQYFAERDDIDYVWLLDNDAVVSPQSLGALVSVLDADSGIAAAGSAMYDMTKPERMIEVGNHMSLFSGRIWGNQRFAQAHEVQEAYYDVDTVSACSMCVRKSAICTVGLWDRNYFLYFDDVDWNIRFRKQGYRIAAVPGSVIWHMPWEFKPGFATAYYITRNVLYLMSKHLHGPGRLGLAIKEASLIKKSFLRLSSDPLQAMIMLTAIEDFLMRQQGRYRGLAVDDLERSARTAPLRGWIKGVLRIAGRHTARIAGAPLAGVRRIADRVVRQLYASLGEGARLRVMKLANRVFIRGG